MTVCPGCGQANPDGFRFCGSCGAALRATGREERKVVTALFCDLVGFTQRAEQLDPEDVRALVAPYWEHVRGELERYGGTVEKFIGDAVMALFGAPVAHEDDPERAVRAALAIRDWAREQEEVQVRIGVATGDALVRVDADAGRGEGMASGDVVNTAARIQTAAPVNGVVVGEATWRATRQAIDYEEREPLVAKGKSQPVRVWEPLQARSRLGVDVVQQSRTPLVGRRRELDALLEALRRAREGRTVQLVTLVGVPGIGKSRLVYELALAQRELVTWRQGRSLPYGEGVAMWALGEMVKAEANIFETDAPEDADAKLAATTGDAWVLRHLRTLLGVADDRPASRDEAFAAWREYLETLAERRPAVIVFEDLHWADDTLLDFVDHLVEFAADVPLLVVATARPELLERRPGWGGGKRNATTISLDPLAPDETAELAGAIVDWSTLPEAARETVLARAEGNPLYAEQFVRALLERADLSLPETVQGLIAARLDGLPAEEKVLLQDASVLGKVFWTGAVAAIGDADRATVDALLHSLVRKEFVRRERRPSIADESEWSFRHVLTRDVAYSQIPRAARAGRHVRAAEWIESLGRSDDHAEMLAHHYSTALELAEAAGVATAELAIPAYRALRLAGDRAAELNAYSAAAQFYARALELAQETDKPKLLFGRARSLFMAADEGAAGALAAAEEALAAGGHPAHAAEAAALAAEFAWFAHGSATGRRHLERALRLLEGQPASAAKARVFYQAARFAALDGETETALRRGREALALAEGLGLEEVAAGVLAYLGLARCDAGDRDGISDLERALERAVAVGSSEAARIANNLAVTIGQYGIDVHGEKAALEEAIRLAERYGNARVAQWARVGLAWALVIEGRWDEACAAAETVEDPGPVTLTTIATIAYGRGLRGALRDLGTALDRAREFGSLRDEVAPVVCRLQVEAGAVDAARAIADELLGNPPPGIGVGFLVDLAFVADELDRVQPLARVFAESIETEWVLAARELLAHDHRAAAARFRRMYAHAYEAHALLRTDDPQSLARALDLYRAMRATRYAAEAEARLAATAQV